MPHAFNPHLKRPAAPLSATALAEKNKLHARRLAQQAYHREHRKVAQPQRESRSRLHQISQNGTKPATQPRIPTQSPTSTTEQMQANSQPPSAASSSLPPPKRKSRPRRKHNNQNKKHHLQNHQHHDLTHDEIWDDDELIQSWDTAFAEYQKYHALHLRGEMVEGVLDEAEEAEEEGREFDGVEDGEVDGDDDDGEAPYHGRRREDDGEEVEEWPQHAHDGQQPRAKKRVKLSHGTRSHPQAQPQAQPTFPYPQSLLPHPGPAATGTLTHSDALRGMMMSWYWAGYYTGVVEGRIGPGDAAGAEAEAEAGVDPVKREADYEDDEVDVAGGGSGVNGGKAVATLNVDEVTEPEDEGPIGPAMPPSSSLDEGKTLSLKARLDKRIAALIAKYGEEEIRDAEEEEEEEGLIDPVATVSMAGDAVDMAIDT